MASPTGVLAIIRASRPTFRSKHDKVCFAVHAVLSANGLRLLAVGDAQTDNPDEATLSRSDEAPMDGWNVTGVDSAAAEPGAGSYSFLYAVDTVPGSGAALPAGAPKRLLVKAIALGSQLLVNLLADPAPAGSSPQTLELDVEQYSGGAVEPAASYGSMDGLVAAVQQALNSQVKPAGSQAAASAAGRNQEAAASGAGSRAGGAQGQGLTGPEGPEGLRGDEGRDPLRDYTQPAGGPSGRPGPLPPSNPLMVGEGDLMPGGLPRLGGMGGMGGPMFPGGGGMHMGPTHPAFSGRGGPGLGPMGPGHPGPGGPGMRWDPIAPEGLQGWNPDDFVRGGGRGRGGRGSFPDNDIMNPHPDNMFG